MTTEDPRPDKVAVVEEVRQRISDTDALILTDYRGLDVPAMAELRRALRAAGGEYKVYKNTLVRLAVRDLDLDLEDLLLGPTALAFVGTRPDGSAGDAVLVAKALQDFAKTHASLVVKGGLLGDKILDAGEAVALAKVPPREEMLARLAGGLAAPMQKLAGLLSALPRNFAYGLQALIDKGGSAEEAPADTAVPSELGSAAEPAEIAVVEPESAPGPGERDTAEANQDAAAEPAAPSDPEQEATPEEESES
ncbi:MAG: 50S ribosomal protein L10 [Acidimicrobiales bacterium]|nr:MAG: 50S ribosomal protein L10 [Actinomycetota bacterium]MBV6510062.1 50S ribosomal protein L10 [Acidimicrobiales bacterium]RIK02831.1 MAG: 50S ribosomal protein L10 [Acidobacteriota bacterium]